MRGAWVACVLLVACVGGPAPADGGTDARSAIAEPAQPAFTPCPPGWHEVIDAHGVMTCDPWPDDGYHGADCALDEAHWPGTPGCTRIGTACAADGWPTDLPADQAIVYVDGAASIGGDGTTRATALQHIADALMRAPTNAVIALRTGRYDEAVVLTNGVTLWGACVSATRIVTSAPSMVAALTLGAGTGARNLAIDGSISTGVSAGGAGTHTLESVVVEGATTYGIWVSGANLMATDLVVRGTLPGGNGLLGRGIHVQSSANVTLTRALVEANHDVGVFVALSPAHLTATDLVVRQTLPRRRDDALGHGMELQLGAQATLARTVVEDNGEGGLVLIGSTVDATDLVVRGTRPASDGSAGRGIDVECGASGCSHAELTLARTVIEDNRDIGVFVSGAHAILDATDLVVRRTGPRVSDAAFGTGVWAQTDAHLTLHRARIEQSHMAGLVSVAAAGLVAEDLVVSGVESSACGPGFCAGQSGGFGLVANFGGMLSATRFTIDGATLCGVLVGTAGLTSGPSALDLMGGVVDDAQIGACVQVDGYDTGRLEDGVMYGTGIGVPLQATSYAFPEML